MILFSDFSALHSCMNKRVVTQRRWFLRLFVEISALYSVNYKYAYALRIGTLGFVLALTRVPVHVMYLQLCSSNNAGPRNKRIGCFFYFFFFRRYLC